MSAVGDASGVIHGVKPMEHREGAKLGPTLRTTINVNGVATEALVDTGSPSTIITLEFLLGVLVKTRPDGHTREQWKEDTFARFSDPDVTLNSYGGHQLDLIAQTPVHLLQGTYYVDTIVLVQKVRLMIFCYEPIFNHGLVCY